MPASGKIDTSFSPRRIAVTHHFFWQTHYAAWPAGGWQRPAVTLASPHDLPVIEKIDPAT